MNKQRLIEEIIFCGTVCVVAVCVYKNKYDKIRAVKELSAKAIENGQNCNVKI